MIYITNARINILSITEGCKEYGLSVAHNSQQSVTTLPRPTSRLGKGVEFGELILWKIIKMLPPDVRFKG